MSYDKQSRTEIEDRLAAIRLLSLDADGVLTDGGIYFNDAGEQMRKFNVRDGVGIKLAQAQGVQIVIITASSTPSIRHRAIALGVNHVFLAVEDKCQKLREHCENLKLPLDRVAHVGDDVNDLPVMDIVGCPLTVADAIKEAKAAALYITDKKGGEGAVREICDIIVSAKNRT